MSLKVSEIEHDIHWFPAVLEEPPNKLIVLGWNGDLVFKCKFRESKKEWYDLQGNKVNVWMWKKEKK